MLETAPKPHIEAQRMSFNGDGLAVAPISEVPSYLDNPLNVIEERAGETIPAPMSPDDIVVKALHNVLRQQRSAILELPSHEAGIDMDRVNSYRDKIGFPKREIRVLEPDEYYEARKFGNAKQKDELEGGAFLTKEDVIIVKRDPDEEAAYGTGITESRIIHEIAHSSSEYSTVKILGRKTTHSESGKDTVQIKADQSRVGFLVPKGEKREGLYLEEGYAEYERGVYVSEVMGRPDGFITNLTFGPENIANKYLFPIKNGDGAEVPNFAAGGLPALTLELLIKNDPELLIDLRDSRHSVEALRKVAQRIDTVQPGLYKEMRQVDIEAEGANDRCFEIYEKVIGLIYGPENKNA